MSSLDAARQTQLNNTLKKAGKSLDEVRSLIEESKLTKHSEIRQYLMDHLGLGYGDANALVHFALASDGQSAAEASGTSLDDIAATLYTGSKAPIRPLHDRLMAELTSLGAFETVPKKNYFSLRRKKQFAMVGPGSKNRLDVGLNARGLPASERLKELPPGGMCQYQVLIADAAEIDAELLAWIRTAYDSAG